MVEQLDPTTVTVTVCVELPVDALMTQGKLELTSTGPLLPPLIRTCDPLPGLTLHFSVKFPPPVEHQQ